MVSGSGMSASSKRIAITEDRFFSTAMDGKRVYQALATESRVTATASGDSSLMIASRVTFCSAFWRV